MKQLKELREMKKIAERLGLEQPIVKMARHGHPRVTGFVNGKSVIMVLASTPSDFRAIRNQKARLKRLMREAADA